MSAGAGEVEPGPACNEIQEAIFEGHLDVRAIAEAFREDFGANPGISDCEKICKNAEKGCCKTLRKWQGAERQNFDSRMKIAKDYCKTVSNKDEAGQCKDEIKRLKAGQKSIQKQDRREIHEQCENVQLRRNCETSCNEDIGADTCEDLFFSDIGEEQAPDA